MLPVSLDCLFSIASSVFSNVYLSCVLCSQCCQCLWIVYSRLSLRFSVDCLFSIAPSVFSNVYFNNFQAIYSDLKEEANYLIKHPVMGRWLETWTLQVDFGTVAYVNMLRLWLKVNDTQAATYRCKYCWMFAWAYCVHMSTYSIIYPIT